MRRGLLVVGLVLMLGTGSAEAGVGDVLKNAFTYATSPVNCVVELGRGLLHEGIKFTTCFLGNVNRNPATLNPIITGSVAFPTL